jgi:hypothetical protein
MMMRGIGSGSEMVLPILGDLVLCRLPFTFYRRCEESSGPCQCVVQVGTWLDKRVLFPSRELLEVLGFVSFK